MSVRLPDQSGRLIFAGKLGDIAVLDDIPPVPARNLRVALADIPGLLVSEVSNGSLASLSYRGLGEPHESWNVLTLQDAVPAVPTCIPTRRGDQLRPQGPAPRGRRRGRGAPDRGQQGCAAGLCQPRRHRRHARRRRLHPLRARRRPAARQQRPRTDHRTPARPLSRAGCHRDACARLLSGPLRRTRRAHPRAPRGRPPRRFALARPRPDQTFRAEPRDQMAGG